MSARRSFDVRSKPRSGGRIVARRRVRDRRPLKVRKREALKRTIVLSGLGILLLSAGILVLLARPELRIATIAAPEALDPQALVALAAKELEGTYFGLVPRDSFLFYPERAIRESILAAYPAASAVAISRTGLTSLEIATVERVSALRWCGTPTLPSNVCYHADAEGFIFGEASAPPASTTPALEVYAELVPPDDGSAYPLRATVEGATSMPEILRFVRAVQSLGVIVERIAIRGDEADLVTSAGVRITYVIGEEEAAATSAAAAFPNVNLKDGSVEYLDLRFPGKAYVKKTGE